MSKIRKKLLSVTLLCMLFCMLTGANTFAASRTRVDVLYYSFMSQKTATVGGGFFAKKISLQGAYFTTTDINGNGVKELIIKEKNSSQGKCKDTVYIFTVRQNKVVYCGSTKGKKEYSNSIWISTKYRSICGKCPSKYIEAVQYLSIKNGKAYTKADFYISLKRYFVGGSKVSKESFTLKYKSYRNSLSRRVLVQNTVSNRRHSFGY